LPPLAVRIELPPAQIAEGDAEMVTVAPAFIETVAVAVAVQLLLSVPVIVYVVEAIGLTVTIVPKLPLLQAYVFAPLAVKDVLTPGQTDEVAGLTETVGFGFTVTDVTAVFLQPLASVPVT